MSTRRIVIHPDPDARRDFIIEYISPKLFTWIDIDDMHPASNSSFALTDKSTLVFNELTLDMGHAFFTDTLKLASQPEWIISCSSILSIHPIVSNRAEVIYSSNGSSKRDIRYLFERFDRRFDLSKKIDEWFQLVPNE